LAGQDKTKKQGAQVARRRRSFRILLAIWGAGLLALVVGGAFAVYDVRTTASAAVVPEPAPVVADPRVTAVTGAEPAPTPQGLAAALGAALANPALGEFSGSITDTTTGTVLWQRDADRPMVPASTTKVLTAAAAVLALPADHRVDTRVVQGARPGEVVLVGGGDPTVTALPVGTDGFYPGAPHIDDLARQIRDAGVPVDTVLVDVGAYSGDTLARGWFPEDVAGGYIAPLEPVMLDGARSDPAAAEPPRSATPALDAGRALAVALGADPATVALGSATAGAAPLATVQSAPLRDRLGQMIVHSDNVLAEAVGREVAAATGRPVSFTGAVDGVLATLADAGFDTTGVVLHDVSGLSVDNRIPARLLDAIVAAAADPDRTDLRPLLDDLPVAGATGTLADRYGAVNRAGAGWVRAKTGTLDLVSGLTGYVVDVDGRVLSFALVSNERPPHEARPALDAVASVLRGCGCR